MTMSVLSLKAQLPAMLLHESMHMHAPRRSCACTLDLLPQMPQSLNGMCTHNEARMPLYTGLDQTRLRGLQSSDIKSITPANNYFPG
jgi:hypothetical protein